MLLRKGIGGCLLLLAMVTCGHAGEAVNEPTVLEKLATEAQGLGPLVQSAVAKDFLAAVRGLPHVADKRIVYRDAKTKDSMTEAQWNTRGDQTDGSYERHELDEAFYYYTLYGTPLAFVRPLDLVGIAGLSSLEGARVVDYGFGSIGQLRLLAECGAYAHGIDIDPLLECLYNQPSDTGRIQRDGRDEGELQLHFGYFPEDQSLVDKLGGSFDVFFSKNTLKGGYVHPEEDVDPRFLLRLGVDDETFVRTVYDLLRPGGFFMIYNLCPGQVPDNYNPQADGRSPFSAELLEQIGFSIIAFDTDDTQHARMMGKIFEWSKIMNFETDIFGMYTLVRKT